MDKGPTVDPELVNEIDEEVKQLRNEVNHISTQIINIKRETT